VEDFSCVAEKVEDFSCAAEKAAAMCVGVCMNGGLAVRASLGATCYVLISPT